MAKITYKMLWDEYERKREEYHTLYQHALTLHEERDRLGEQFHVAMQSMHPPSDHVYIEFLHSQIARNEELITLWRRIRYIAADYQFYQERLLAYYRLEELGAL